MRLLLVYLFCAVSTDAYNVLVCYPFPAKSLNNLGEGIVRHLLNAGHKVTYVTVYPKRNDHPNFQQIDVSRNEEFLAHDENMNISYILESKTEVSEDLEFLQDLSMNIAIATMQNANMKKVLENPREKFDVVIADFIETELFSGLAALYNVPMIWSYSMGAHWLAIRLIDDPPNPAYASDYFSSVMPPFSFQDRLWTLWQQMKWRYVKTFKIMPQEEQGYKTVFGPLFSKQGRKMPEYKDIIYNASLILSNEHYASGKIPKTPQNWKLVGGYHIHEPPVPLPKDLQTIMDNAKHGVIYFSMGSMWKSDMIPKRLTEDLLELFGSLKQTVLWKYETKLENLPKNIHTLTWAPQQSILAHPNCAMFLSHGGLLSSTEAIHFGVPTIGIPVSYDQYININKAVSNGYALRVDLTYNLVKELKPAIEKMISDSRYKIKAKELSSIYHDRPVPPGKELVHWVEHVVRTKGAIHLRSPSLEVPLYQKAYLDIIAICAILISVSAIIINKMCCRNNQRQKKVKTK